MKSARQKGIDFTREVRKILEGIGHTVEGPGYGLAFYAGKMNPCHKDFFGTFDLISFDGEKFIGHQVSTEANKSVKIKLLQGKKLPGWVWCRFSNEEKGAGYEVYEVDGEVITEFQMTYGIRRSVTKINIKEEINT